MTNIVHVIGQFRPIVGGMERACERLALQQYKIGSFSEIVVLTLAPRLRVEKKENLGGIKIYRTGFFLRGFLKEIHLTGTLFRYLLTHRESIVHFHGGNRLTFMGLLVCSLFSNVKTVVKITNSGRRFDLEKHFKGKLKSKFYKASFIGLVDGWQALTQTIKGELEHAGVSSSKIHIVPNGFSTQLPVANKRSLPPTRFITVSTLKPKKNIEFILSCFDNLPGDWRLSIVGGGPDEEKLKSLVSMNPMGKKIEFLGEKTEQEIAKLLTEHDVFLQASVAEGMSNALLEALSFGIYPLCSDIPANQEFLSSVGLNNNCLPFMKEQWRMRIQAITNGLQPIEINESTLQLLRAYQIENVERSMMHLYEKLIARGE